MDVRLKHVLDVAAVAASFHKLPPQEVIAWALSQYGPRLTLCTSFQVDGVAIVDMAWRIDRHVRVFTIDTGRLPPETYGLMDRVREHYSLAIDVIFPETDAVEDLARSQCVNGFYRGVPERLRCCETRKVHPLRRALKCYDAWMTGLRRDQASSRRTVAPVELDQEYGDIVKVNPLAEWSEEQVWAYVRENNVPYNPLYDRGYTSIGCAPCTRAVASGEDARAGRWWWERGVTKECGMHCVITVR
ncbi:MAG: phosphoadenylyl-sulfate reductase [Chloroflexi bacterium]|nr:phosphoadenylyl-sulfate reductase [Chloroflexota bacterium]